MDQGQQRQYAAVPPGVILPPEKTAEWSGLWQPPQRLPLSQWAERNFHLAPPSRVTGLVPLYGWQRPIFDSVTDPNVREITLMVGTQMTKTLLIQATIGYAIDVEPGPILAIQPKDDDAKDFMKENIRPMIAANPAIARRLYSEKKRNADHTLSYINFHGGFLAIVGAGSAGNLARRPIRYLLRDEIDRDGWDPDPVEGDKLKISSARVATYKTISKTINTSTPTYQHRHGSKRGRIHRLFQSSDQRELFVACPFCDDRQVLDWANVRVDRSAPSDKQAETALYHCRKCEKGWDDVTRWAVADRGQFAATAVPEDEAHVGFHLSHLASPIHRLAGMWRDWAGAATRGDENARKEFYNIHLALPVEDAVGDAPEAEIVYGRREPYPANDNAIVPARGLFLTCGVDVQSDRLEWQVVAWGKNRENWSMGYGQIRVQDETTKAFLPASDRRVWKELDEVLHREWMHENGRPMKIVVMCVDHGHLGTAVDDFVARNNQIQLSADRAPQVTKIGTVVAVQGSTNENKRMIVNVSTVNANRRRRGVPIVFCSTLMAKDEIYHALRLPRPQNDEPVPGYCHFSMDYERLEWFEGLCSERRIERPNGRVGYVKETANVRNEPLDTWGYARWGYTLVGAERYSDEYWGRLAASYAPRIVEKQPEPAVKPNVEVQPRRRVRARFVQ